MTGGHVQWLISGRDFRLHAFNHGPAYLEALCDHTIPPEAVVRPQDTALTPEPCTRCLRLFGERENEALARWHD